MFSQVGTASDLLTVDGHLKGQSANTRFPENSVFHDTLGNSTTEFTADFRLNAQWRPQNWQISLDYQAQALEREAVLPAALGAVNVTTNSLLARDRRRLWDLSEVLVESDTRARLQRLDRLSVGYQRGRNVVKIGRQAISWGNGLVFSPMDFFNPFDPSAIDTEYKPGDDMLYVQHLLPSGDDIQVVYVARRDERERVTKEVASVAAKYHGFIGFAEVDVLAAEHFDERIWALGGSVPVGGAVWRGDLVHREIAEGSVTSAVTSLSYSWMSWGKNVSGVFELFHSGFGRDARPTSVLDIHVNTTLAERLARGELFTTGRDYLGANLRVEQTPLWVWRLGLLANLNDQSALLQWISRYDVSQNIRFTAALTLPTGADGTEYGGLKVAPTGDRFASRDSSFFVQIAWYF